MSSPESYDLSMDVLVNADVGGVVDIGSFSFPLYVFRGVGFIIGQRSLDHHKWYLRKFRDDYPKQRKALIPLMSL